MNEICCEDCKFSISLDEEHHYFEVALQCRRYPTHIRVGSPYVNLVRKDSWCGEWKPRIAASFVREQNEILRKNINKYLKDIEEREA